jgi:hypothetical protein
MTPVRDNQYSDSTLYTDEAKRGLKIALDPIRPDAPVIMFDTKTPTEIDPQYERCACCGVWAVDCENAS